MSKVISVLEKMASDATMNNVSAIADLVVNSDMNEGQQQAIIANDVEALVESTAEILKIKFFIPLAVADDEDEEQANTVENKTAVNF